MADPLVAYCDVTDLFIDENFQLPSGISKQKYVQQAADEIDSKIGRIYITPIRFETTLDRQKFVATVKLLKWVNAAIATGRLIMAIAMTGENAQVHAYASHLIKEAYEILNQIIEVKIILEGAKKNDFEPDPEEFAAPHGLVYNRDANSAVESFYDFVYSGITDFGYIGNGNLFRP